MPAMESAADIAGKLVDKEGLVRTGFFFGLFFLMLVWELRAPRRELSLPRSQRWAGNLLLMLINTLVLRLLFPAAAVGLALSAEAVDVGLFNRLDWPPWIEIFVAVILLDLAIYWQHRLMHQIPLLWRLHRVHHADLDIDLTTGARFHTFEILLSMLIKWALIMLLGPAALAVLIFEVILSGMAVFNHANVGLPPGLEPVIRALLVTPDMHRVHHSVLRRETDSNYGFNLSIWDRLFKSYIAQPQRGHREMTIGIPGFRDRLQVDRLPGMLTLPFVKAS